MFIPLHPQTRKRLNEVAAAWGLSSPAMAALVLRAALTALSAPPGCERSPGNAPGREQPERAARPEHPDREPEVRR